MCGRCNQRFDPAPLLAAAARYLGDADAGPTALALALGVTARQVRYWRAGHVVRLTTADSACTALGMHPAEVWGTGYYDTDSDTTSCAQLTPVGASR